MALRSYQELIGWKKGIELVTDVYRLTQKFPKQEIYGLTSQIRRAAVSVPSNIAEGQGRSTTRDFLRCLSIASGSLQELETQLIIASRLNFLDESFRPGLFASTKEVARLINGLTKSLT